MLENSDFKLLSEDIERVPLPTDDNLGSIRILDKIHVFTEFCPIKSIILGYMSDTA